MARARWRAYRLPMDVPGISRLALVTLIVVSVLLLAVGATEGLGLATAHTDTSARVLPAGSAIEVDIRTADLRVVAADRDDLRLTTKVRGSVFGGGHAHVALEGARLHLDDRCRSVPVIAEPCSVSYVLEVPRETALHVMSATGDVHAEDLGGRVDLTSATGDLHVVGGPGPVRLASATGDVHVDAPAPDIAVHTATGDIDVVAHDPSAVRADSAAGDVDVVVPPGQAYAVEAQSDGGDDHVGVRVDADAPRQVHAHSGSGDVHVEADG